MLGRLFAVGSASAVFRGREAACYAASFHYHTTIGRSGKETFELGQREVQRMPELLFGERAGDECVGPGYPPPREVCSRLSWTLAPPTAAHLADHML